MRLFSSPLRGAFQTAANRRPGLAAVQPTSQLDGLLGLLKGNNRRGRRDPGGAFDAIGNTTQSPLLGQSAGLLPRSPQAGFNVSRPPARDPHDEAVAALLGRRSQPARDNAFRQRAIDQGLARDARRRPGARVRPPEINLSGFGERELDALTEQIGAFRQRRFAGAQVSDAPDNRTGKVDNFSRGRSGADNRIVLAQDLDGDGESEFERVCLPGKHGLICRSVPKHKETEEERDEREREEVREGERFEKQQRARRKEAEEQEKRDRIRKQLLIDDNIRSTRLCQQDPDCRLA